MNKELNPKLLDLLRLPEDLSDLPAGRTGTVVEVLNTVPDTVLVEASDEEGVLKDLIVSEAAKTESIWRASIPKESDTDSSSADASFEQGLFLLQNGLIPKAKAAFAQAFQIEPRFAGTLMNYANESANRAAFEVAIFLYEMILELQPSYHLASENLAITHLNRGVAFARRGVMDKAIEAFNNTLLLKPMQSTLKLCVSNLVAAYTSLGMQLVAINRYEEAIQFFFLAFQLNPTEDTARRNLALALVSVAASEHKGRAIPPLEAFRRFISMGLALSECLNAYGATLATLGQLFEAKALLQRAVEIDPTNILAKNNLDILESPEDDPKLSVGIKPFEPHATQVASFQ